MLSGSRTGACRERLPTVTPPTLMAAQPTLTWPEITSYVTSGAHAARLAAWYCDVAYSDESNGLLTRYLALWQLSAPVGAPAPGR